MRRRGFLLSLGGVALTWPMALRGQSGARRVAVLMGSAESDGEAQRRLAALKAGLAALGWKEGANLIFTVRWTGGDTGRATAFAKEFVASKPDVIVAHSTPVTAAVRKETSALPIVFVMVSDPIGSGFVKSLSSPGGNITGYISVESSLAGKWVQLLKDIAPRVKNLAVMFNPKTAPYADYYLKGIGTTASKLGAKSFAAPVESEADITRAFSELARAPGSGLIIMIDSFMFVHRKLIIAQAAQHKLPTIYYFSSPFVEEGGLISYGFDPVDIFQRSAISVDKILRGAKPEELPVEHPLKFELSVNLKTAKSLGLKVPQSILTRASRVIE